MDLRGGRGGGSGRVRKMYYQRISQRPRVKKDVCICSSVQSSNVCFQALGDVLKADMMNASFTQSPLLTFPGLLLTD